MIPGSSPPLRKLQPASGSSASISQSRASVLARAVKGRCPHRLERRRLRPATGQQRRGRSARSMSKPVGQRDLGVKVEELLLDRLLLEPGGAQAPARGARTGGRRTTAPRMSRSWLEAIASAVEKIATPAWSIASARVALWPIAITTRASSPSRPALSS
jgi:hypothetical protein